MTTSSSPSAPVTASSAPRWVRVLLVLSLALNLLVAGIVLGNALTHGGPGRGPRPAEMALDPVARALDPGDRRAILHGLRGNPDLRPLGEEERGAALDGIAAAVRAEPFDAARLREALSVRSDRIAAAQRAVQEALVARIAAMSPDERAAFAGRLEDGPRRR